MGNQRGELIVLGTLTGSMPANTRLAAAISSSHQRNRRVFVDPSAGPAKGDRLYVRSVGGDAPQPEEQVGVIPLAIVAAKKLGGKPDPEKKAARAAKRAARRAAREQEGAETSPGILDSFFNLFRKTPKVAGLGDEGAPLPQDKLGAILIDTDGRRVLV